MASTQQQGQNDKAESMDRFPRFTMKRPSRDALEADIEAVNKEVASLDEQLKKCKMDMDAISKARNGSRGEVDAARNRLNSVLAEKRAVMAERSQLVTLREQVKTALEANKTAEKNLKSQLRFDNLDKLNGAIRDLEKKQMTTSMNLQDEKRILADIKSLKALRSNFSAIEEIKKLIEMDRERREDFDRKINEMNRTIDEASARVNEAQAALDEITRVSSGKLDELPALKSRHASLRAEIKEKFNSISVLRDNFKKAETDFHEAFKEFKEKERVRREQEAAARKEKIEQERKDREAAELLRVPYEEEMQLCDFLISYLTLQQPGSQNSTSSAPSVPASVGPVLVPRAASAPEGLVALNRDAHDDPWAPKKKEAKSVVAGAAGSSNATSNSKKKQADHAVPVRHDLNSLALFGQIGVAPPLNVSNISVAIEELKAKKAEYSVAERGSLPSMYEARKAKDEERLKQREKEADRALRDARGSKREEKASVTADAAAEGDSLKGQKKGRAGSRNDRSKPNHEKEIAGFDAVEGVEKDRQHKHAGQRKARPSSAEASLLDSGSAPVLGSRPKKPRSRKNSDKKPSEVKQNGDDQLASETKCTEGNGTVDTTPPGL